MDFNTVLNVALAVMTNKFVIIVFAVVILYLSFINFIVHYRKRPKPIVQKKKASPKPAAAEKPASDDEAEDADEE